MNSEQAGELLLERFGQLTYQFLDASTEVWSSCPILKEWKAKYDEANTDPRKAKIFVQVLFAEFNRDFKPFFGRLNAKDATVFEEPFAPFVRIQASEKFKSVAEDIQNTCWDYIVQIVQSATIGDVYSKCPEEMIKRISTMADTIVNDIQNNRFDITKLNPMEISKQMMQDLNPEDLEVWGKTLMDSGNVESIMGMMSGILGGANGVAGVQMPPINPAMIQDIIQSMNGGGGAPFDLSLFQKK